MLTLLRKKSSPRVAGDTAEACAVLAGELFDRGNNCTQAVLQAVAGRKDPDLIAMAAGFGGGIGDSGCLCGAITGGVMALGLNGRADQSGPLIKAFKAEFKTTCCRGLSKGHRWLSRAHLANCRRITSAAAAMAARLLER